MRLEFACCISLTRQLIRVIENEKEWRGNGIENIEVFFHWNCVNVFVFLLLILIPWYHVQVNIKSYANNNELAVMPTDRVTRLEWDRRYLSVLGVENNRLYELRLQTPESVFLEEENELRQVMDSFRVNKASGWPVYLWWQFSSLPFPRYVPVFCSLYAIYNCGSSNCDNSIDLSHPFCPILCISTLQCRLIRDNQDNVLSILSILHSYQVSANDTYQIVSLILDSLLLVSHKSKKLTQTCIADRNFMGAKQIWESGKWRVMPTKKKNHIKNFIQERYVKFFICAL